VELCKHHLEEVEALEKRKHNDGVNADRVELFGGARGDGVYIDTKGKGS
jgi:hypothetical protein